MSGEVKEEVMDGNQWHLNKGVPVGIIFAILLQICSGVWFAAQLTSQVNWLWRTVNELEADLNEQDDILHDVKQDVAVIRQIVEDRELLRN